MHRGANPYTSRMISVVRIGTLGDMASKDVRRVIGGTWRDFREFAFSRAAASA